MSISQGLNSGFDFLLVIRMVAQLLCCTHWSLKLELYRQRNNCQYC